MKLKNSNSIGNISHIQQLLIKACLASTQQERECIVRDWEEQVVINDLDFSSSRLIPFFFHGNQQFGIVSKHDKRLKTIYKHWWLRTQHISHELKKVATALSNAGVKTVVIKGASIKMHYELDELRPMVDFDLLVQPSGFERALDIVKELGYRPNDHSLVLYDKNPSLLLDFNHAISYSHQRNDTQIDLHWRVGSHCSVRFTDLLWSHLEDYKLLSMAQRPSLAYEVFMLMIHAVHGGNKDNLNWIIDIAVINKNNGHTFWKEARAIAVAEKKEDLFDYGCSVLIQLGIYAPDPGIIKKPSVLISTAPDQRGSMSAFRLFYARIHNIWLSIDRLFPYSNTVMKKYHIVRRLSFYFVYRASKSVKK